MKMENANWGKLPRVKLNSGLGLQQNAQCVVSDNIHNICVHYNIYMLQLLNLNYLYVDLFKLHQAPHIEKY